MFLMNHYYEDSFACYLEGFAIITALSSLAIKQRWNLHGKFQGSPCEWCEFGQVFNWMTIWAICKNKLLPNSPKWADSEIVLVRII